MRIENQATADTDKGDTPNGRSRRKSGDGVAATVMLRCFRVAQDVLDGVVTPEVARAHAANVSAGAKTAQNADRINELSQASPDDRPHPRHRKRKLQILKELMDLESQEVHEEV